MTLPRGTEWTPSPSIHSFFFFWKAYCEDPGDLYPPLHVLHITSSHQRAKTHSEKAILNFMRAHNHGEVACLLLRRAMSCLIPASPFLRPTLRYLSFTTKHKCQQWLLPALQSGAIHAQAAGLEQFVQVTHYSFLLSTNVQNQTPSREMA